jgi:hypothetical protein
MYVVVAGLHSRTSVVLALSVVLCAACGDGGEEFIGVGDAPDAATTDAGEHRVEGATRRCDSVGMDGEFVIEHEQDFTAWFRVGEPSTRTVMLFGGEPEDDANVFSNAQMLAERYPDFYLCSSPGGVEAASHILPYDLVPATCEVYDRIVAALRQYHRNAAAGGDRTSLRLDGAPLQVESVTENATGKDFTDQVSDQNFHLVTGVEQLTGESVLSFGNSD